MKRISPNKEINIKVWPWDATGPTKVLNSVWSWVLTSWNTFKWRLDWVQNAQGKMTNPKKEDNQLRESPKDATGSKIENKLAIIFNLN